MILTIGLIKADLVTAGQAIEYFEANRIRISRILRHIICSKQQRSLLNIKYTEPLPIQTIQSSIRIILKGIVGNIGPPSQL